MVVLSHVPPVVSLMCTDCEGSWPADWLLEWHFTTCPNCGGELRLPSSIKASAMEDRRVRELELAD